MKRCKNCGACQECGAPAYPQPIRPWPVSPWPYYPPTYPVGPYWSVIPSGQTIAYSSSSTAGSGATFFKTDDGPDETGALAPLH